MRRHGREQVDRPDGKLLGAVSRFIDLDDDASTRRTHADDPAAPAYGQVESTSFEKPPHRAISQALLSMQNGEGPLFGPRARWVALSQTAYERR